MIGFYTTRLVNAPNQLQAQRVAEDAVLAEWQPGGEYAEGNRGALPTLAVDDAWQIGLLSGIFGRRPVGYSFYARED